MRKNPEIPLLPPSGRLGLRQLAFFRYQLRRFLRFSEGAARAHGLTPLQHQLLLGVAGFTGRGWATITELSEFLQARHNAVVGLVQRAESRGLVRKQHGSSDQRFVRVYLLRKGQRLLGQLTQLHQKEVKRFEKGMQGFPIAPPAAFGPGRKAKVYGAEDANSFSRLMRFQAQGSGGKRRRPNKRRPRGAAGRRSTQPKAEPIHESVLLRP